MVIRQTYKILISKRFISISLFVFLSRISPSSCFFTTWLFFICLNLCAFYFMTRCVIKNLKDLCGILTLASVFSTLIFSIVFGFNLFILLQSLNSQILHLPKNSLFFSLSFKIKNLLTSFKEMTLHSFARLNENGVNVPVKMTVQLHGGVQNLFVVLKKRAALRPQ